MEDKPTKLNLGNGIELEVTVHNIGAVLVWIAECLIEGNLTRKCVKD